MSVATQQAGPSAGMTCVKCGQRNDALAEDCVACGAHLWVVCHECEAKNRRCDASCSRCGRRLRKARRSRSRGGDDGLPPGRLWVGLAVIGALLLMLALLWTVATRNRLPKPTSGLSAAPQGVMT